MTILWSPTQRATVHQILQRHPSPSGECFEAAAKVLPHACALTPTARAMRLDPSLPGAAYVDPARGWDTHAFVDVTMHAVDALTGPDGHPVGTYLTQHFAATAAFVRATEFSRCSR